MNAHRYVLDHAENHGPPITDLVRHNINVNCHRPTSTSFFDFLTKTVVGQQLSSAAARPILQRLEASHDAKIIHLRQLMSPRRLGKISECSFSKNNDKALARLDVAFEESLLSNVPLEAADYDQVVETITSLWRIGPWSTDMVAIFYLNMPDVWPEQDATLSCGLQILVPDEDSWEASLVYTPERTYLGWHIWIGLDTGLVKL